MKSRKILLVLILAIILGSAGFYLYLAPRYVVPILMYHHIDEHGATSSLSVSAENFQRQIGFLSEHNYNVISLADFVQAKEASAPLPRNTVVITFDDGYEDNYTQAYPVLREYNLPATIFVIVDAIGEEGYLDYPQISEMLASGLVDIGSHSLSGGYLPGKTRGELEQELGASKRKLEANLGKEIDSFCYPIGGFTADIQEMLQGFGYQAACTTNRGTRQTYLNNDILALKRIKIKDDSLFVFWVKASGYYNFFRTVRKPD